MKSHVAGTKSHEVGMKSNEGLSSALPFVDEAGFEFGSALHGRGWASGPAHGPVKVAHISHLL